MLGEKTITADNELTIAGCNVVELARKMGTPLYLYDEEHMRSNMREYMTSFSESYPTSVVAYAGKAFLCSAFCRIIQQEGLWLDVVSGGEYYLARQANFPPERIIFHGNNKTDWERREVLKRGIGRWVIDSEMELEWLMEEAQNYSKGKLPVLFRITPGIDPHTHRHITTGTVDSKFGLPIEGGVAERAIAQALLSPWIEVCGVHCHIGSQISSLEPFEKAAEIMLEFMASFQKAKDFVLRELDMGGGLGVPYLDQEKEKFPSISQYVMAITDKVKETCARLSFPLPFLLVEPGRSIVNTAGSTVYQVGVIKEVPGGKKYVAVDGGMSDNPRPILYDARYQAVVANRVLSDTREVVSIAGKCCESGDVLINEIELPKMESGDILLVEGTGAYNFSMASRYNLLPCPGVVFLRQGEPYLVVRPENWGDLVQKDLIPDYLGKEC
ncbi:MAG: diaminopimelate decarboxylase [Candidatus Atribacteria bacterium]|nr:diaminopimelate decarboxylase [Candidatus Atribacteria bacterium]